MTTTQVEYLERWKQKQFEYSLKSSSLEEEQKRKADFALSKFSEVFEMSPAWDELSWERFVRTVNRQLNKYGINLEEEQFQPTNYESLMTSA